MKPLARLLAIALVGFPLPSAADCTWVWDCTVSPCVQKPVCESSFDMVPVRPTEIAPVPPVKPVPPVQSRSVPPIGTRTCRQEYLCDSGNCRWVEVCY